MTGKSARCDPFQTKLHSALLCDNKLTTRMSDYMKIKYSMMVLKCSLTCLFTANLLQQITTLLAAIDRDQVDMIQCLVVESQFFFRKYTLVKSFVNLREDKDMEKSRFH